MKPGPKSLLLDRRTLLRASCSHAALSYAALSSAASGLGALAVLPGCQKNPFEPPPKADGTFELPYSADDPGDLGDKAGVHTPLIYAGRIDDKRVRMWVEIRDPATDKTHDQNLAHYIEQIRLTDSGDNDIGNRAYTYDSEARMITDLEIPADVKEINAYGVCNLHGVWRATYAVENLAVDPTGDLRRAFTLGQPGELDEKAEKHLPVLGKRPDGSFSIEVGDRENGGLHPMDPEHFIQTVFVFDEFDQQRLVANLGPNFPEPVVNNVNVDGTTRLRIIAWCNEHLFWEAEYSVTG